MKPRQTTPLPRVTVGVLGLVTIVAYGVAYYSYGVLVDPIKASTHWSSTALGAIFSAVLVISGIGGLAGGRLVDRLGTRPAFLIAGTIGAAGIAGASYLTSYLPFAGLYAIGCGVVSALGFYHITQPAAVRAAGDQPQRAVVWLTVLGAFASPIFLPLTAWLVDQFGWRSTLRIQAGVTLLAFLFAAIVSPSRALVAERHQRAETRVRQALTDALQIIAFRRWVLASVISGAAIDIILVNQVPIMIAAGLSTGAAATIGGLRGLGQLAGRLPLSPVLARLGTHRTIVLTFVAGAAGTACLLKSGTIPAAILYSALAGASIGAVYTLQGIYTNELVGAENLSLLMGAQQGVFAIGGACGPVIAGGLFEATHTYTPVVLLTTGAFLAPAMILARRPRARAPRQEQIETDHRATAPHP
jgi:MFS family permease